MNILKSKLGIKYDLTTKISLIISAIVFLSGFGVFIHEWWWGDDLILGGIMMLAGGFIGISTELGAAYDRIRELIKNS